MDLDPPPILTMMGVPDAGLLTGKGGEEVIWEAVEPGLATPVGPPEAPFNLGQGGHHALPV